MCKDEYDGHCQCGNVKYVHYPSIRIKLFENDKRWMPAKTHNSDIGWDLRVRECYYPDFELDDLFIIPPKSRRLVKTGVFMEIPDGYEGQIRPRSGYAIKQGLTVVNSPGTIDPSYRGEIGVILRNTGCEPIKLTIGQCIAQLVIKKVPKIDLVVVDDLNDTERGDGGFGSTGQ